MYAATERLRGRQAAPGKYPAGVGVEPQGRRLLRLQLFNPVTAIVQRSYQAMVTDQVPGTNDHEIITIAPEEAFYLG